jgi:hypothetical protein
MVFRFVELPPRSRIALESTQHYEFSCHYNLRQVASCSCTIQSIPPTVSVLENARFPQLNKGILAQESIHDSLTVSKYLGAELHCRYTILVHVSPHTFILASMTSSLALMITPMKLKELTCTAIYISLVFLESLYHGRKTTQGGMITYKPHVEPARAALLFRRQQISSEISCFGGAKGGSGSQAAVSYHH